MEADAEQADKLSLDFTVYEPNYTILSGERKYPPDKTADKSIELCLKQAEALSESWSS